ncbi:MAG: hypothetical protein KAS32_06005 [Candidatus Peribacteraceae bacterium]|nr:hypothetical protein [Candidatus Peribacteraceae bacterium]
MSGEYLDFDKLKSKARHFSRSRREWDKIESPKDIAIAISVEAGELLDVFRWLKNSHVNSIRENDTVKEQIRTELGNVIEKCRKMAGQLGIDLEE